MRVKDQVLRQPKDRFPAKGTKESPKEGKKIKDRNNR